VRFSRSQLTPRREESTDLPGEINDCLAGASARIRREDIASAVAASIVATAKLRASRPAQLEYVQVEPDVQAWPRDLRSM